MKRAILKSRATQAYVGMGELSLVEHALCPLDKRESLQTSLQHTNEYYYVDRNRHRRKATATVLAPLGLSPMDEFYLWGLLALTCSQPKPDADLYATPHYCLRRLGVIDQQKKRGGRQYTRFREALERLSVTSYRNDAFYDPIRGEHRQVSFGFLDYNLPANPASCRAWRISWNPLFFELCMAGSQQFRFDLEVYRGLDCASRRLFLLLQKMFAHRLTDTRFELRHLAVHILGFSPRLPTKTLRKKVQATLERLIAVAVVNSRATCITGRRGESYYVAIQRGAYFSSRMQFRIAKDLSVSPLYEPLKAIGLEDVTIRRFVRDFDSRLVQEWADITLAALERKGRKFFRRSPQAYFVDNLQKAAAGNRTPPDWWHEMRIAENRETRQAAKASLTPVGEIVEQLLSSISDSS